MTATVDSKLVQRVLLGGLAVVFGLLTLVEGGRVLFGGPEARAAAGDVVEFVLRFNVTAGVFYVVGGAATALGRPAARSIALALAVANAIVFAAFVGHICAGGAFEGRTVLAMTLRTGFWAALSVFLARAHGNPNGAVRGRTAGA